MQLPEPFAGTGIAHAAKGIFNILGEYMRDTYFIPTYFKRCDGFPDTMLHIRLMSFDDSPQVTHPVVEYQIAHTWNRGYGSVNLHLTAKGQSN